jgi:predicted MFS family arabinose efflux permease
VNAASFLFAAAAVSGVRLSGAIGGEASGSTQLREAVHHVRSRPILVRLLTGDALLLLFIAAIAPIEVAFITGTLGQSNATLGIVLAVWGAGMIAGGAAAARVRELSTRLLLGGSTLALALSCLGTGASTSIGAVLAWSVVGGLGNGAYGMAFLTIVQERTADAFQARVSALYETIASVAPGLGFVLGGVVAATISPRAVYLLAGAGALAALVWTAAALRGADWALPEPRLAVQPEPG